MIKRHIFIEAVIGALIAVLAGLAIPGWAGEERGGPPVQAQDLRIWKEFVSLLKNGTFTPDRIKPMDEDFRKPLMGFLKQMRESAHWPEWEAQPEVQRSGDKVNCIISLSFGDGPPGSYCFTFLDEKERWMFHHMEFVFIRLDKTPPPPTSEFPDTTEEQKAWDREENYWSKIVGWYGVLVPEKGKKFFFDLMRDGSGYYVWAKSRAPFLPPPKAFIVFLCWEQANLRGQNARGGLVRLEKLTDQDAVVRLVPFYFLLYNQAAHLKQQIGFEDYRELFETIWQDRARAAGWELRIEYKEIDGGLECVFRFHRKPDPGAPAAWPSPAGLIQ